MPEYAIREVQLQNPRRTVWTVVEFRDGVCLGGDCHWLTPALAQNAIDQYRSLDG